MVISSGANAGGGVRTAPHGKLNVKTGPHLAYNKIYILVFTILLIFSRLFFYCVFRCVFPVISGFSMDAHIRIHCHFSTHVLNVG